MATARKIITGTLRLLGIVASGETASASMVQDCLDSLNQMLDSWSTVGVLVPYVTQRTYTMTGQTLPLATRPMKVLDSTIRYNGLDFPVTVCTREEYINIPLKTLAARPRVIWWDELYPTSSIHIYPVPDQQYAINLQTWERLSAVTALDDDFMLPGEFMRAIRAGLAMEIAPEFGVSVPPEVAAVAKEARDAVIRLNCKPPLLVADGVSRPRRGHFDWRTGL